MWSDWVSAELSRKLVRGRKETVSFNLLDLGSETIRDSSRLSHLGSCLKPCGGGVPTAIHEAGFSKLMTEISRSHASIPNMIWIEFSFKPQQQGQKAAYE